MSATGQPRALGGLADTHEEIRERLLAWLDAVVSGDATAVRARFETFDALLRAHAAMEEEFLLPRFVALGLATTGCSDEILRTEHRKLRRLLDQARADLPAVGQPIPLRLRVERVAGCHLLRELLEHHDRRERAGFFPALDAALGAEERAALYEICARSQSSAASREDSPPSSCNS